MAQCERGRSDLQIVRPDHQAVHFEERPNNSVTASYGEIERQNNDGSEHVFDMLLPPGLSSWSIGSLNSVEQFGSGHGGDKWLRRTDAMEKASVSNRPRSSEIRMELSRINPIGI
jgi:hypothetical protein